MARRLRRIVLWIGAIKVVAWIIGLVIARRLCRGDEQSDEFQVVVVGWGKRFESRAQQLRSGSVVLAMGGVDLDLRAATLDPAGATLDVTNLMGGVQITVPEGWALTFDTSAWAGGLETTLTGSDDPAPDAPTLHVRSTVRMGGVMVTADSQR
jgi:hypothetical protein